MIGKENTQESEPRHERESADDSFVPDWLEEAVALPSFEVIDTRSAQGRLDVRRKPVTMRDLILFHGHACDGLLRGAYALRALADVAFPGRPFDRSDLLVVSKNSPCLGDVAAYLTGGRARFDTHRLDENLGVGYLVQVISTGEAWEVREEPGFFPRLIATWEAALLEGDRIAPDDKAEFIAVNEAAQWNWVRTTLLPSRPAEHYPVRTLYSPDLPPTRHAAKRTDTLNRNFRAPRVFASPYEGAEGSARPSALLETTGPFERRYLDQKPNG
jgi:hypothetical protein